MKIILNSLANCCSDSYSHSGYWLVITIKSMNWFCKLSHTGLFLNFSQNNYCRGVLIERRKPSGILPGTTVLLGGGDGYLASTIAFSLCLSRALWIARDRYSSVFLPALRSIGPRVRACLSRPGILLSNSLVPRSAGIWPSVMWGLVEPLTPLRSCLIAVSKRSKSSPTGGNTVSVTVSLPTLLPKYA